MTALLVALAVLLAFLCGVALAFVVVAAGSALEATKGQRATK